MQARKFSAKAMQAYGLDDETDPLGLHRSHGSAGEPAAEGQPATFGSGRALAPGDRKKLAENAHSPLHSNARPSFQYMGNVYIGKSHETVEIEPLRL